MEECGSTTARMCAVNMKYNNAMCGVRIRGGGLDSKFGREWWGRIVVAEFSSGVTKGGSEGIGG